MQLRMLQWLRYYKMLNEMPMTDRPDDDVIADDTKLDEWYTGYINKIINDAQRAKHGAHGPTPDFSQLPQFNG